MGNEKSLLQKVDEAYANRLLNEISAGEGLPEGSEEREKNSKNVTEMAKVFYESVKNDDERIDKMERREIEKVKNETYREVEELKQDVSWKRATIEILKVAVVPVGLAVLNAALYWKSGTRAIKFEETGHYTTTVGRDTALPRIFRW